MKLPDFYFESAGEKATEFVRQEVKKAGSQSAVARKTGIAQPTINRICAGDSNPNTETIYKIAAAYGKPLTFFFGEAVNEPPPPAYLTPQEEVLLKMLRGDPELLSDVVKYTEKEKLYRELMAEKKKANG